MTNEEVIAQAKELCEREVKEWREVIPLGVGENENYAPTQLNSWKTHLAEMEEHHAHEACSESCGVAGWCDQCMAGFYPCDFLITKAKRLLGVK